MGTSAAVFAFREPDMCAGLQLLQILVHVCRSSLYSVASMLIAGAVHLSYHLGVTVALALSLEKLIVIAVSCVYILSYRLSLCAFDLYLICIMLANENRL